MQQPQQLEEELGRAQFCILPSNAEDPNKSAASHNRLVDAIRSGCITIATPLENYKELGGLCLLSDNITKSLASAIIQQERLALKYSNRGAALVFANTKQQELLRIKGITKLTLQWATKSYSSYQ